MFKNKEQLQGLKWQSERIVFPYINSFFSQKDKSFDELALETYCIFFESAIILKHTTLVLLGGLE